MKEIMHRIISVGKAMRLSQQEYFKTRSSKALSQSKKLEREFDALLAEAYIKQIQGQLFQ